MAEHILVPTDGSDRTERAVDRALEMAEDAGGDLHLLHVVDTDRYGEPALSSAELVVTRQEDDGTQLLKRLAARAGRRGVPTTLDQCHGDTVEEVVAAVETDDVDAVVMDRQGFDHGRSTDSVTRQILRTADTEVVLV